MNRMKKNILLGGMLLCAAAFTSCNEDFDNWASPQSNQQGDPTEAYELTVSAGPQANVVMDNAGETANIVIASYAVDNLKSIQLKSMTIEGHSLPYTYEGGAVSVKTAQLDSLIEAVTLDRSATPHKVTVKTEWAVNLLSGEAVPASAETMVTLTPFSNTPEIDPKGYAMLGQWQGWNPGNPTWMTEVEPGVYQALVTTTDDGDNWYKFYKGSGFDEANFPWDAVAMGCVDNGDATSPNLLVWGDDPRFGGFQTPVISGAGQWLVTLDMNKLYYKVEPKETRYYVVGVPNGWSTSDMSCMFYALGGNKYIYTTRWPNQWSLKIWDIDHFGDWSACYGSVVDGSTDAKGSLINSNSQAFGPDANGAWATLTINMGTKEYEWTIIDTPATEYTAVSIIGAFNDWSADTEINMTQLENSPHNWYTRATFTTNTELKFRANHDWGVNWGGDGSAEINEDKYYVAPGGENIKVAAGTYDFYLNDITGNWSIAKVAE
jgi:hypothetical protein